MDDFVDEVVVDVLGVLILHRKIPLTIRHDPSKLLGLVNLHLVLSVEANVHLVEKPIKRLTHNLVPILQQKQSLHLVHVLLLGLGAVIERVNRRHYHGSICQHQVLHR